MNGGGSKTIETESATATDATQATIDAEVLDLLHKGLPRGLAVTLVNAALTAFVMRAEAATAMLIAWLAMMVAVTAVRAVMTISHRRGRHGSTLAQSLLRFRIAGTAAGAAWGSATLMLMPSDSLAHQLFLGFVLAGMAAGAMASLSFDIESYAGYVIAAILPYPISLFVTGGETQIVMGIMVTLFLAAVLQSGRAFHDSIVGALHLRFHNEHIAAELGRKAEQEAAANRQLQEEIARVAQAEAAMRRARDEADRANRAKSQFLANMSHEIRTPMNGVLGMTDLLLKSRLDDRQRHLAGTVKSSGAMLLSIIDDILDLSRIEAGRLELSRETFDPRACVAAAVEMLSAQAQQKDLRLTLETSGTLPAAATGDPVRLRQVCINLIGNAIKFTSAGEIKVLLHGSDAGEGATRLGIEVSDTGIGIERSALQRILQPFEQADSSTSRRYGGTGLGLAISANLVALMGGRLDVHSTPGKGTLVSLDVVLGQQTGAPRAEMHPRDDLRLDGARVLVAEDNPVNQEIARAYLEELGCAVDVVEHGKAAVAACEETRYAAILMDCQMPELDGLEASVQIRALEAAAGLMRTPIVALTASAFQEDRERCFASGMDDHLSKPYTAEQLAAKLRNWVPDRRAAGR